MAELTVIIPARNEMFLKQTVDNVLANMRGDSDIIIICDGNWPIEPIPDNPKVRLIYHPVSIGQRAATNEGARVTQSKYIMKLDAHCAVDEGFDVKLMADCEYDWTVIPRMYNLHAFDRVCKDCGHRAYQGPTECEKCKSKNIERSLVWEPRASRCTDYARFDKTMHFQYWGAYKHRDDHDARLIDDTMTSVGACFFMHRERFWDLGGLDEQHGSWGQFGVEMACKAFLSGGRHVVNKKTWFAHMFRTQGGDFGFPYPISGKQVDRARKYSQDLWKNNKWPLATRKLEDLLQFYYPVPDWHEPETQQSIGPTTPAHAVAPAAQDTEDTNTTQELHPLPALPLTEGLAQPTKGILYYTDNRLDGTAIGMAAQYQLLQTDLPITAVSLRPIEFGRNIVLSLERGYLTMAKQILAGLEAMDTDVVFFCEHDVLYHPTHFDFTPPTRETYYYNMNVWKLNAETGHAVTYITKQLSGLCAYRDVLLRHFRERVRRIEAHGFSRAMGFEPGSHGRKERIDDVKSAEWRSEYPNVDIRHDKNLTASRWNPSQFRDKRNCQGWTESDSIPGWGKTEGRFGDWLDTISSSMD